jgi:hypothetical protein
MIKQSDIAGIVLVAVISLIASFFLSNAIINKPENRSTKVEVVHPISAEFISPSEKIFNDSAINITEVITISPDGPQDPFHSEEEN